jgi:Acyltransferase family
MRQRFFDKAGLAPGRNTQVNYGNAINELEQFTIRRRLQGLKGHLLKPISFINLSRITSGGKFIPEIDGLRFVAIASVVGFHIYEYLLSRRNIGPLGIIGTALLHGNRGVPLFFVISGFILGRPFAAHYLRGLPAPKLKEFYWRRLTRLEPPYLPPRNYCRICWTGDIFISSWISSSLGFAGIFAQPDIWNTESFLRTRLVSRNRIPVLFSYSFLGNRICSSACISTRSHVCAHVRGIISFAVDSCAIQFEHSWMDTVLCRRALTSGYLY